MSNVKDPYTKNCLTHYLRLNAFDLLSAIIEEAEEGSEIETLAEQLHDTLIELTNRQGKGTREVDYDGS